MMVPYLIAWFGALTCAFVGFTLAAAALAVVLIVIIFRWELLRLLKLFGPTTTVTDG